MLVLVLVAVKDVSSSVGWLDLFCVNLDRSCWTFSSSTFTTEAEDGGAFEFGDVLLAEVIFIRVFTFRL